jgi:glycosyltransferase involved in cell wall biosynthesis
MHHDTAAPSVQVLMATYNGHDYLPAQLDSLMQQHGVVVSLLVRDDGSGDDTRAIIDAYALRYPGQIARIESADRLGAAGSFYALLRASTQDYIAFCDQDDVWDADKLAVLLARLKSLEALHGSSTPLLVHSDLRVVDADLTPIADSMWAHGGINPERNGLVDLLFQNTVTGCATLVNRALVLRATPAQPVTVMHDHWLALHAAALGHIGVERRALIRYRQHGRNVVGARHGWLRGMSQQIRKRLGRGEWRRNWSEVLAPAQAFQAAQPAGLSAEQAQMLSDLLSLPRRNYLVRIFLQAKWHAGPGGRIRKLIFWLRGW